jgi:hypothetical protein
MRFLYNKYQAKKKEILEVELDQPTKVKFMTASEFKKYTLGKSHSFYGGRFEETPVRFVVPFDSMWHVVIEKGSYHKPMDLKASCKLTDPDRRVLSSIAADAPEHIRRQAMLDQQEEASVPDAEEQ